MPKSKTINTITTADKQNQTEQQAYDELLLQQERARFDLQKLKKKEVEMKSTLQSLSRKIANLPLHKEKTKLEQQKRVPLLKKFLNFDVNALTKREKEKHGQSLTAENQTMINSLIDKHVSHWTFTRYETSNYSDDLTYDYTLEYVFDGHTVFADEVLSCHAFKLYKEGGQESFDLKFIRSMLDFECKIDDNTPDWARIGVLAFLVDAFQNDDNEVYMEKENDEDDEDEDDEDD